MRSEISDFKSDTSNPQSTIRTPQSLLNPLTWLTNMHGATIFAVAVSLFIAAMPLPGDAVSWANAGKGGLIIWPLFGATNQLLAGLAFMVILFYLWRRGGAIWFLVLPALFMLVMPAWGMLAELPGWWEKQRWVLVVIAVATLALEVWMVTEAALMFPKVRNVLEGEEQPGFEVIPVGAGN